MACDTNIKPNAAYRGLNWFTCKRSIAIYLVAVLFELVPPHNEHIGGAAMVSESIFRGKTCVAMKLS